MSKVVQRRKQGVIYKTNYSIKGQTDAGSLMMSTEIKSSSWVDILFLLFLTRYTQTENVAQLISAVGLCCSLRLSAWVQCVCSV